MVVLMVRGRGHDAVDPRKEVLEKVGEQADGLDLPRCRPRTGQEERFDWIALLHVLESKQGVQRCELAPNTLVEGEGTSGPA
jgi:hypothetical protein